MTFREKLLAVQTELKATKDQYNSFGKYNYRSCESILEAVKPLLKKYGMILNLTDELMTVTDRIYIKATATLVDAAEENAAIASSAFAREPEDKKGMDESQITGTASSYARKYALNALFLIDDNKDADTDEHHREVAEKGQIKRQAKAEKKTPGNVAEMPKKQRDMLDTIRDNCADSGIPEAWVCGLYKVERLEELKPASQKTVCTRWPEFEKKYAEENRAMYDQMAMDAFAEMGEYDE